MELLDLDIGQCKRKFHDAFKTSSGKEYRQAEHLFISLKIYDIEKAIQTLQHKDLQKTIPVANETFTNGFLKHLSTTPESLSKKNR